MSSRLKSNSSVQAGVEHWLTVDGPGCGWFSSLLVVGEDVWLLGGGRFRFGPLDMSLTGPFELQVCPFCSWTSLSFVPHILSVLSLAVSRLFLKV